MVARRNAPSPASIYKMYILGCILLSSIWSYGKDWPCPDRKSSIFCI